jgi:GT2 family glycosyltransferase
MIVGKLILHYNTPELTNGLCKSVPDAIVIDNGSEPGKEYTGRNECIRLDKNYGFTIGWNKGIKAVYDRFDAFWLMNSDIEITDKSIKRICELLLRPEISMITPSYNCWLKMVHNRGTNSVREVSCLEFTAPVIKKSVFKKIGFFDERFTRGYGVDFDFCLRMQKAGLRIFVDDHSSFIHKQHQTIKLEMEVSEYSRLAVNELRSVMSEKYGEKWREMITQKLNVPITKLAMRKIALYTTIFGDYAKLLPVPAETELDADLFCITDNPDIENPGGWKIIVPDYPRLDLAPRMRAKFFKIFPWEAEGMSKYEAFIFIDGSIEITDPDFVKYCLKHLTSDILVFKHPARNCIYEELKTSLPLVKYKDENIEAQCNSYKPIYPVNGGLYACGVMMVKNNERVKQFMGAWWWENIKWSFQDQLSFPVICKLLKVTPAIFPDNQMKNNYFKHHWRDDDPKSGKGKKKLSQ